MDLDVEIGKARAFMAKYGPMIEELYALHAEGKLVNPPEKKPAKTADDEEKK